MAYCTTGASETKQSQVWQTPNSIGILWLVLRLSRSILSGMHSRTSAPVHRLVLWMPASTLCKIFPAQTVVKHENGRAISEVRKHTTLDLE